MADTGLGIPPEYLPHVFEKFFRVPGRSQGRGTGLGLAIVREIVTAHHGEVACESEPGKGTVFTLTIPVWKGGRQGGKESKATRGGGGDADSPPRTLRLVSLSPLAL